MRKLSPYPTIVVLATTLLLDACAAPGGPPAAPARVRGATAALPLHTEGRFIVGRDGKRVRITAVNWYGAESEDFAVGGLQFRPLDTIAAEIRHLGFNAVRLPWSNELVERNPVVPDRALTANPDLRGRRALDVLDLTVAALTNRGLMVVLDNHNSDAEWCCGEDGNELWYNERYPESSWIADWKAIVARYLDDPLVVGVDLRNEPRSHATWGGPPATDWHAAAERGGNAVLATNPNLLVFVEGVAYASDLSGVDSLPVALDVAARVVYEAHDYSWFEPHASYEDWVGRITPKWGYLVTGPRPQPLWIGEFGTCYRSADCIRSDDPQRPGFWFDALRRHITAYGLDWAYWGLNGTQSTGEGRRFGAVEGYGVLDRTWNGVSSPTLMEALRGIMHGEEGATP